MNRHKLIPLLLFLVSFVMLFVSCSGFDLDTGEVREESTHSNETIDYREHIEEMDEDEPIDEGRAVVLLVKDETDIESTVEKLGGTLDGKLVVNGNTFVRVRNLSKTPKQVKAQGDILEVEYDTELTPFLVPTDELYSTQYALQRTDLETVWDNYTGSGVKIAVIDTGVNTLHSDFGGSSTFVSGYDASDSSTYTPTEHRDKNGHGTHVAGIIGARMWNDGIVGVAPDSTLMPYKASGENDLFSGFNLSRSIIYATDAGAQIINMSLGGFYANTVIQEAVQYALSNNVVVVAASGNEGAEFISYPASYTGVISVGSSNGRDEVSNYSTRSPVLSVVAPGENILSLDAGPVNVASSDYVIYSGTSMAAPFVAGVAALLLEKFPTATPWQIKKIIEDTAKDIGPSGFDFASGHGRVQPVQALATTSLPNVSVQQVTFDVKLPNGERAVGMPIHVMNDANSNQIYDIIIATNNVSGGSSGIGMLPSGSYSFTSNWLGVPYNGTFTVGSTSVSVTKTFVAADFSDYYRVSLYDYAGSSTNTDTYLEVHWYYSANASWTIIAAHDDINYPDNPYSTLTFKPASGERYRFLVSGSPLAISAKGYYNIILQKDGDIFSGTPNQVPTIFETGSSLGSSAITAGDKDNNSSFNQQTIAVDAPITASIYWDFDKDYFFFTAP